MKAERKNDALKSKNIFKETLVFCDAENDRPVLPEASEYMQIDLVTEGSGTHNIYGQNIPCSSGEIYIIPENIIHSYCVTDQSQHLCVLRLSFKISDWISADYSIYGQHNFGYGAFLDGNNFAYALLTQDNKKEIRRMIDFISKEANERNTNWENVVKSYLSLIFITVSRYVERSIKNFSLSLNGENGMMNNVLRCIEDHYSESDFNLEALAEYFFVSPSTLSRLFLKYMDQSFSDFLRSYRMNRASRLLAETDETVTDIMRSCGLKDIPTFYRSFSKCMGMTPNEYRKKTDKNKSVNIKKGDIAMSILNEISENLQAGKAKVVKELVQKALDEGISAKTILDEGLISGMDVIGEKFKNNEIYIPEVLVAARALNMGTALLKPYFSAEDVKPIGRVCIGTVQGDLHDIGKNLVKMMMEGKRLEVIDLGTDVSPETFVNTAIEQNCQIICCSALLTTTMGIMKEVVDKATEAGIRDKVKIMIGGAPVNEDYCKTIGADVYTVDAASAADAAVELMQNCF